MPVSLEDMVLLALLEEPGADQRSLANAVGISQPTVSRVITRCGDDDLIEIHGVHWPGVKRRNVHSLSPNGEARVSILLDRLYELRATEDGLTVRDLMELGKGPSLLGIVRKVQETSPRDGLLIRSRRKVTGAGDGGPSVIDGIRDRLSEVQLRKEGRFTSQTPLFGRVREREHLLRRIGALHAPGPKAAMVIITGPAGAGKSSLMRFAREAAERRGVTVREAHITRDRALPLSPLEDLLGGAAGRRNLLVSKGGEAYLSRLLDLGRTGPHLLILDNLQDAPPPLLSALRIISSQVPGHHVPVLLLASARTDEVPARKELMEFLYEVGSQRLPTCDLLPVPPLSVSEARALADHALRGTCLDGDTRALVDGILERSQGNPLFILEGIKSIADRLVPLPEGGSLDGIDRTVPAERMGAAGKLSGEILLPVPDSLARLVETRLSRLSPPLLTVLKMASLVGSAFDAATIEHMAAETGSGDHRHVRESLHALSTDWGLLRRLGPHSFSFSQPLLREVLLGDCPHEVAWYHTLAGWWAANRPGEVERVAAFYYRAGDGRELVAWAKRAIDRALEQRAWGNAETYLGWLRELLGGGTEALATRAEMEVQTAIAMRRAGAMSASRRILLDLSKENLPEHMRWRVETLLISVLNSIDPASALSRLDSLERRGEGAPPAAWKAPLMAQRAWLSLRQGQPRAGLKQAESALRSFGRSRSTEYWYGTCQLARATALFHIGRPRKALASISHFRYPRDPEARRTLRIELANLEGRVLLTMGEPRKARNCFRRGYEAAKVRGDMEANGLLIGNLALSELRLEDLSEAGRLNDKCLSLSSKYETPLVHAWGMLRAGEILFHHGDRSAITIFQRAEKEFSGLGMDGASRLARAYLLLLEAERGGAEKAIRALVQIGKRLEGTQAEERPPLGLFLARLWEGIPDPAMSRRALRRSLHEARRNHNTLFEAHSLSCLARWEELHGEPRRAREFARLARATYRRLGIPGSPAGMRYLPGVAQDR